LVYLKISLWLLHFCTARRYCGTFVGHLGATHEKMKKLLLAAAVLVAVSTAAHSTEDFCAVVLKTPDGFLALREKPGAQAKMTAKLREGDFLYAGTEQCSQSVCDNEDRKWTHVNGVPRLDGPNDPTKTYNDYTHGWVSRKYIQEFLCPEDQEREAKPPKPQAVNPSLPSTWSAGVAPPPPPTMEDAPDWLRKRTYKKHR
jgi:hypothetical protein